MAMAAHEQEKPTQEVLSLLILLADRVIKSAQEAKSFMLENSELGRQVTELSQLLRSTARLTTTSAAVYDRPIRRVADDVTKNLDRALTLARKCQHRKTNILHHVLSITTTADFKKVSALLDSSWADLSWVLSILSPDSDDETINLSVPPIASTYPLLAWVWQYIAAVHMGRAQGAHGLAMLAVDNERKKDIIVDENGIPPLLKMLRESGDLDAQDGAASALFNLADDQARVRVIVNALGVPVIVKALQDAPMRIQVTLVNLASRMLDMDVNVQEEFGRENLTRPLVTLLGTDVDLEEFKEVSSPKACNRFHSLVQVNKELMRKDGTCSGNSFERSKNSSNRKEEREAEPRELKSRLKVSCAIALWKLARGSFSNSRKITDTKALLVVAKIMEKEGEDLKINCLKVVMELAVVAESDPDLKRAAFKPTSHAPKVVLNQLLRVISEDKSAPLVILAVKIIGCLATTFPAKEKRVVEPLVAQLGHRNPDVAAEAAKALIKFVCDYNYNRKEHSGAIIEFDGVPKLMNLLRRRDCGQSRIHELVLLCHLAINVGNSKALEQARAASVLEGAARHAVNQHPHLRELFANAIHQLTIYQAGAHIHRQAYVL